MAKDDDEMYAVVGDEAIETSWCDTPEEAIEEFNAISSIPYDGKHYTVEAYSAEERVSIDEYSELHPQ